MVSKATKSPRDGATPRRRKPGASSGRASRASAEAGADNRDRLIQAARKVAIERGLAGATLSEIARAAGISAGFVHYFFGGKDGLMTAAMEALYEEIRAVGLAADPEGDAPLDGLKAQALCWFDENVFTPELCGLWMQFYAQGAQNPAFAELERVNAARARALMTARALACAPEPAAREIVDLLAPLMEGFWVRRSQHDPHAEPDRARAVIIRTIDRWSASL